MSPLFPLTQLHLDLSVLNPAPLLAAVEMKAELYSESIPWLSNSTVVSIIVVLLILWFARGATRRMELVPTNGKQNTFEAIVELLYNVLEGIVGKHMVGRALPLLATIFIFIVTANWMGLLPGVGTIGFSHEPLGAFRSAQEIHLPIVRPSNADVNMTLGMAMVFMVLWFIWTMQEAGPVGYLKHMFGPPKGVSGIMLVILVPIFMFVGVVEVISTVFRPMSLSMRLFGNIYAGETLLHTMAGLGDGLAAPFRIALSILAPLPFYFLEILVGLLQALVFTLLCAVYLRLSTSHDPSEEGHH